MRIEFLEPHAVGVRLDDKTFPLARVWRGRLADGTQVLVYAAAVVARDRREQNHVDDELRGLPPIKLTLEAREALDFAAGAGAFAPERAA